MKTIQLLAFFLAVTLSVEVNAQTKTFEIIPEFPKPGEQFTISYNPIATNLKNAADISGVMYVYDDFKWIVKDFSLAKTRIGTWETREQLSNHAALISCVFYSGSEIDNGGKQSYALILEESPGAFLGWTMLHAVVFQNEVPVKADTSSFVNDSVALSWLKTELEHHPSSRLSVFYQLLTLNKIVNPPTAEKNIKSELRFVLTNKLDNPKQYNVQKTLRLLDGTKNKVFIDSVQNALLKKYPNGVWARDLALKKIFLEPNPVLKAKQYLNFVIRFPKPDFEDVNTDAENLYNDTIYKSIVYHSIAKNNDYSIAMNSLKELSFANLIDLSRHLVSVPFNKGQARSNTLNFYASTIIPEILTREYYVPKEYREKLSLGQWRKFALQNTAHEYFIYAKILEINQNFKESQRFLEKIKPEYGYKNASFNEMYYRMLIRNAKIAEAKSYFELSVEENNASPEMIGVAMKNFLKEGGNESGFENYLQSLKTEVKIVNP